MVRIKRKTNRRSRSLRNKTVRKNGGGGNSNEEKSNNSNNDYQLNNAFFENLVKSRMEIKKQQSSDPYEVVKDFMKTTKRPYAIIGGKAAAYYIEHSPNKSSHLVLNVQLALSTGDYDIIIPFEEHKEFLNDLHETLKEKLSFELDVQEHDSDDVQIILMGIKKKGFMNSVIDVHILGEKSKKKFPKLYKGSDGLMYASKDWICKELESTIKSYSSNNEEVKALKRIKRYKLLDCK